jgi:hypothetical protein
MNSNNPLAKHFRHPSIHFKLPSGGKFWPDGSLNLPLNGEIPIYPMTTRDEIVLRTPDALMNGSGIVEVIQSCCPNILDAWQMPSIDVDAVLIAIRIASYGSSMEIETTCPKCSEEASYDVPLDPILAGIQAPNYSQELKVSGISMGFKPQAYFTATKINIVRFQEDQIIRTIGDTDLSDDERKRIFDEQLTRLVDLNIDMIVESTAYIKTDDGTKVTEREFIKEFYENCETKNMKLIRAHLDELRAISKLPDQNSTCSSCNHKFKLALEFDQANFFAIGS